MSNINEIRKKRYHVLRQMGYSPQEASRLRGRSLDVSHVKIVNDKVIIDKNKKRNNERKKRYHVLRQMGYSPQEASQLRGRSLDVSDIKINPKTKKVVKNKKFKNVIRDNRTVVTKSNIVRHQEYISTLDNDTVLTRWGMITHDDRYKDETAKIVNQIRLDNDLSNDQAYYFYYVMTRYNLSYQETKNQLLSNREFEMYDKRKRGLV